MSQLKSFLALALWLSVATTPYLLANERPHIVVFLSDDHTITDSSVYGSKDCQTPQMERIAQAGLVFDRAFVASPSCAPSRASLLTGLMPARHGAQANHARPQRKIKKLPAYLQELGYEVVSFGKVGHYAQTPEYGFDIARHHGFHDDVAVAEALKWLNDRTSDKPLCLFVGTNWPHVPWSAEKSTDPESVKIPSHHVQTPATRRARAKYYDAVRKMDEELGQVYDAAYAKLGKNTLFVHTSDHGAQWPFGKWTLYDDGIRTPLVAVWPERIGAGKRSQAMVSWVDLLPTLVEAAGGKPDENLDGRSILPVLLGKADEHRSEIFTTHSGDGNFNVYPMRSVRDQRYKYIRNLHPEFAFTSHVTKARGADAYWPSWLKKAETTPEAARKVKRHQERPGEELYDLEADPTEQHNLASEPAHAERLAAMQTKLDDWMQKQKDQQQVFGMPKLLARTTPAPNIVMILIDDLGYADFSCYGNREVETTNIDRLAREGLRFTSYYTNAPICSPSRVALTTGQYPARHRITSYLADRKLNESRGMVQWLDQEVVTLPRMLTAAGYACGHFGKWHQGGQRDVGEAPLITEYGFQQSLTNFEGLGPRVLPLCDAFDGSPVKRHDLGSAKLGHGEIKWHDRSRLTSQFVEKAIGFIDASVADGKPFYINVWPDDVHSPFYPPKELRGDGSKRALYLGVLKSLDTQLGVLFDRIRSDEKLRNNTIILVASDNGHEPGAGSAGKLRGAKGNLYEGGIRSPLIVWGPGMMASHAVGKTNETTLLSGIDLVASLASLGKVTPPEHYRPDGEDLQAALLGLSDAQRSSLLFWRRPPDRPGPKERPFPDLAVRDGSWKLLCRLDGSSVELYDLSQDSAEETNVADKHPAIVKRLVSEVTRWNSALP